MAPRPVDVEIRATGTDGVRRQLKLVGDEAGEAGEKSARSARGIAGALLMIAHHGEVSSRELKELLREGGELATMFGGSGVIVGGVALLGAAFVETFSQGNEAIEKTRTLLKDLGDEYLKLVAEIKGNKLAAEEIDLNAAYNKQIKEIEENAPGAFRRVMAHLLAGLSSVTGGAFTQMAFDQYAGRVLGTDIATRTAGAIRLKQEEKIQQEAKEEAERKAVEAAKLLEESRKRAFEGAAFLAANDLSNNNVFGRVIGEGLKKMWQQVAIDAETAKVARDSMRQMIQNTIDEATRDVSGAAESASSTVAALRRAVPLFSPEFWRGMTSYIKQDVAKSIDDLAGWINQQIAQTIGAAIHEGFMVAFQKGANIGNVFAAVASTILSSLGAMIEQFGESMLAAFMLIAGLKKALELLAPEIGIPLAIATIAFGAALQGAGARVGANSPVGYGGGYSASSAYSAQQSIAGGGQTTIIVPGGKVGWDLTDPDDLDKFNQFLEKVAQNRIGNTNVRVVPA